MNNTWVGNVKKGFTIVELVIVVAVIGILATVLLLSYSNVRIEADKQSAAASLKEMQDAIDVWRLSSNGVIPVDLSSIDVDIPDTVTAEYWRYDNNTEYCLAAVSSGGQSYYRNSYEPGAAQVGKCSEISSVAQGVLAIEETPGNTATFTTPIDQSSDVTLYAVVTIIDTNEAWYPFALLAPATTNNRMFLDMGSVGSNYLRYRVDTSLASNIVAQQDNARTPGTHIGWLKMSDSSTLYEFAYDKTTTHASSIMMPGSTWSYTGLKLNSTTSSTVPVATVLFNEAHDQTTRSRVMQWLATKYGVPLTF